MSIENENLFKVALTVDNQIIIHYYRGTEFSPDEALNLAAWLAQLAHKAGGNFDAYVDLCERIEADAKS